jgi:hypothetical protein
MNLCAAYKNAVCASDALWEPQAEDLDDPDLPFLKRWKKRELIELVQGITAEKGTMEQGDARPTMGLQDVLEVLTSGAAKKSCSRAASCSRLLRAGAGALLQDAAREQDLFAAPDVKDDVHGRRKC